MDDLIKSFKAQLYDRVTSPLFSTLLITWATWNHRLFFALVSSSELQKKFDYIDEVLYPTWKEVLGRGTLFPLLSALFLIYVFPKPARWVYEYTREEHKELKKIQQRIDDETPITVEEARELRSAIRKAEAEFDKAIDERNKLIEKLKLEISQVDLAEAKSENVLSLSAKSSKDKPDNEQIDERQVEALYRIAKSREGLEIDQLISSKNDRDRILIQHAIDELLRKRLIEYFASRYSATPRGRAKLVENGRLGAE